jgi:LmbE family N-acetylglucosaminyl deacetylase
MKTSAHRAPAIVVSLAFLVVAALPLAAQLTPQQDPANLAGERVSPPDLADTLPLNHGAPALEQLLRKLRTRASFMLIVAHPDDEDNGALTYLSRGQGARVATLTLNRGEGGQNLMSADFDDALGLIRTQELLAADRYMAVDQFFGTEVDFGFSKTKEEAFAKWTHDRVLYDAVRAIRLYRPLVIASVFIGEPSDGHGQHQVAGEIAQEAFKAAGDPNVFPDQIAAGLQPWQPLKVYARAPFGRIDAQGMFDYATSQYVPARFDNYVTGKVTETVPKANVTVPEGDTDPLLGGESYAQLGREGRSLHRSQVGGGGPGGGAGGIGGPAGNGIGGPGGGVGGSTGRGGSRFDVSYHRYGSHVLGPDGKPQPDGDDSGLESGFFDGIDTTLPGIATLAPEVSDRVRPALENADALLAKAQHDFDATKPEAIAPTLRDALRGMDSLIQELENGSINDLPPAETYNLLHELHIKRVQLNNALVLAYGVELDAESEANEAIYARTPVTLTIKIAAHAEHACVLDKLWLQNANGDTSEGIAAKDQTTNNLTTKPITRSLIVANQKNPFDTGFTGFLTRPYFDRKDIEQPVYDVHDPALRNAPQSPPAFTAYASVSCDKTPLQVGGIDASGDQHRLNVVPNLDISLSPRVRVLPPETRSFAITVTDHSFGSRAYLTDLCIPTGCVSRPSQIGGENRGAIYTIDVPRQLWGTKFEVKARGFSADQPVLVTNVEGYRPVGYPGLTYTNYYTPATLRVVPVDVTTAPNLNIAYLPGTGDDVPAALDQLGVHPHLITAADLTPEALKPYDAVVLGVRAYERPELAAANPALNAYAAAGGIVIAQYNTGRLPEGTGPYPLDLGGSEKVVEEDTPVHILTPDNPLLTWPNKITAADFDHWVEERGHGFMATWDPHYAALLETHDPGQQPQLGGLLVARTGRGAWIYLGLALYRQLPEGVPGPYRLFANLISAARNPGMQK